MIHTNNYTSILIKGDIDKVGEEWVLIGKALYEKMEKEYGELGLDLITELFGKVISGEKAKNVYWEE